MYVNIHDYFQCTGKGWSIQKKILTCAIPEGVCDGEIVRLNIGEQHVFIKYHIMEDRIFSRDDFDVLQRVKVPLSQILLGGQIQINSLSEKQFMKISIPECSQPDRNGFETSVVVFRFGPKTSVGYLDFWWVSIHSKSTQAEGPWHP